MMNMKDEVSSENGFGMLLTQDAAAEEVSLKQWFVVREMTPIPVFPVFDRDMLPRRSDQLWNTSRAVVFEPKNWIGIFVLWSYGFQFAIALAQQTSLDWNI
jgi:hypothetical protein